LIEDEILPAQPQALPALFQTFWPGMLIRIADKLGWQSRLPERTNLTMPPAAKIETILSL